ncbi:DMT family transporter [Marinicella gelatinilytica]|uniref:DMT family transporter n=1 Tax=Marinicella gelatinilytica TaxID=2996017 RepID=UPI002260F284|nr:DMT family transporter [Marinicella gelatinilytica]MCX7545053.1 DMT family transporter [Marinicella gelatinilytica]
MFFIGRNPMGLNHLSQRQTAGFALLFGAVLISTSSVWVKLADLAPTVSGFYRMAIGGGLLIVICVMTGRSLWHSSAYAFKLFLAALFFAVDLWLWHRSILFVGPGLATVLGNFQVFFMTLFGVVFLSERVGWRFLTGLGLAFLGLFLLVGVDWSNFDADYRTGVIYGLSTALAYTGFMLVMRQLQGMKSTLSPMSNLGVMSLMCAAILAVVALFDGDSFVIHDNQTLLSMISLGVFCQVLGWVIITRSMPLLATSLVGLILLLQPALSMLWDIVFFSRPTSTLDIIGFVAVMAGIYVASVRRKKAIRMNS